LPCLPTTPHPLLPIHPYLLVQALINAGEIPNVDPYEEHVPLYVPDHPAYHDPSEENMSVEDQPNAEDADSYGFLADSDSMEDDTDTDSIDYPDEP
ncbi:hypothetical protein Tco_0358214, partial [Tanacetum coccineum]